MFGKFDEFMAGVFCGFVLGVLLRRRRHGRPKARRLTVSFGEERPMREEGTGER